MGYYPFRILCRNRKFSVATKNFGSLSRQRLWSPYHDQEPRSRHHLTRNRACASGEGVLAPVTQPWARNQAVLRTRQSMPTVDRVILLRQCHAHCRACARCTHALGTHAIALNAGTIEPYHDRVSLPRQSCPVAQCTMLCTI